MEHIISRRQLVFLDHSYATMAPVYRRELEMGYHAPAATLEERSWTMQVAILSARAYTDACG